MSFLFWFNLIEWTICLVMIPVIISRRMMPTATMAWLAIVFFMPTVGLIAYVLVGSEVLGRRRRRLHRRVILHQRANMPLKKQQDDPVSREMREHQHPMVIQTECLFGMPVSDGNAVELLTTYESFINLLLDDIAKARDHVHLLFYIFEPDETGQRVADALIAAQKRGLSCRVIADAAGSMNLFARGGLAQTMRDAGVRVIDALPVSPLRRRFERLDLRNHRKLVVIDGRIGYTGSHNIINREYPAGEKLDLTDLSARFTGHVVAQLQIIFIEDWIFETEGNLTGDSLFPALEPQGNVRVQTVPSGPNEESETFRRVLLAAVNSARRRLIITTPYLALDEATLLAISMAAYRGVSVEIITTERSDYAIVSAAGRSFIDRLLEYDVRVYLFQPGLLHTKALSIDDSYAILGSANLDMRSFNLNFELNAILYGEEITARLREIQERYMADSTEIDVAQWRARPRWRRLLDDTAALLSPIL
jgi:cardiolipin synthase A/B